MPFYANATEFLRAVQARYRALQAYSDTGLVRSFPFRRKRPKLSSLLRDRALPRDVRRVLAESAQRPAPRKRPFRNRPHETQFSTAYRAPGLFRFAFSKQHPYWPLRHIIVAEHVCGSDGSGPYQYRHSRHREELQRPPSLELAVAGATGISAGSAHTIGTLLFEECDGFTLLNMRRIRFRGEREIDGVACMGVTGRHPRGGRVTAWFGVQDLMLRCVVEPRTGSQEFRFNIRVDDIDPTISFDAPVCTPRAA